MDNPSKARGRSESGILASFIATGSVFKKCHLLLSSILKTKVFFVLFCFLAIIFDYL